MRLWNVYYIGSRQCDLNRSLPAPNPTRIAYVQNVNDNHEYLIPTGGTWARVTRETALLRRVRP